MAHLLLSDDDVEVYFKLYILLYADDTVIFAENEHELQAALNAMFLYCKSWDLEVNPTKTKITTFSNKKLNNVPSFKYNGHNLEVDDSFVYLGTLFSCNGRFLKNSKILYDQARKAMYSVLRKSKVFLLIFSCNFLIAWWLQFYYTDQKFLDSKKVMFLKVYISNFTKLSLRLKKILQM